MYAGQLIRVNLYVVSAMCVPDFTKEYPSLSLTKQNSQLLEEEGTVT